MGPHLEGEWAASKALYLLSRNIFWGSGRTHPYLLRCQTPLNPLGMDTHANYFQKGSEPVAGGSNRDCMSGF